MRISADKTDPGFRPDWWRYAAYLDGREIPMCMTADEEQGFVIVLLCDEQGHPGRDADGKQITYRREGRVELRRKT